MLRMTRDDAIEGSAGRNNFLGGSWSIFIVDDHLIVPCRPLKRRVRQTPGDPNSWLAHFLETHSSQKLYTAATQTSSAISMKGRPPENPAKPVEILCDRPAMNMRKRAVPTSPPMSLTVLDMRLSFVRWLAPGGVATIARCAKDGHLFQLAR
mgnify:CR=1 FL=1